MNQWPTAELQKRREWVWLDHMHPHTHTHTLTHTHTHTHTAAWRSWSLLSEAAEADGCLSVLLMRPSGPLEREGERWKRGGWWNRRRTGRRKRKYSPEQKSFLSRPSIGRLVRPEGCSGAVGALWGLMFRRSRLSTWLKILERVESDSSMPLINISVSENMSPVSRLWTVLANDNEWRHLGKKRAACRVVKQHNISENHWNCHWSCPVGRRQTLLLVFQIMFCRTVSKKWSQTMNHSLEMKWSFLICVCFRASSISRRTHGQVNMSRLKLQHAWCHLRQRRSWRHLRGATQPV